MKKLSQKYNEIHTKLRPYLPIPLADEMYRFFMELTEREEADRQKEEAEKRRQRRAAEVMEKLASLGEKNTDELLESVNMVRADNG